MTKRITDEQAEAIRDRLIEEYKESDDFKEGMISRESELIGDYLQSDEYEEDFEAEALEVMI